MSPVLEDRLITVQSLPIKHGSHESLETGACVMELASYIAGENWSDSPECVCPVIGSFLRSWNDCLSTDEDRTRLLAPLLPKIIGTRGTKDAELARVMLCVDWYLRTWLPAFLELTPACAASAAALREHKAIQSWSDLNTLQPAITAAHESALAAWNAAWNAAENAAWNAARNAAWNAARNAAENAAWNAAENAARNAAWNAAWNAAENAARNAAENALAPTVTDLQASAVALVERMCAVR